MSSLHLLRQLFRYQAWANDELLVKIDAIDAVQHANQHTAALRLVNHNEVVNQIFMAHLAGRPHGFAADNTPETPALARCADQWPQQTAGIWPTWTR